MKTKEKLKMNHHEHWNIDSEKFRGSAENISKLKSMHDGC